jgi:hypothetical protein
MIMINPTFTYTVRNYADVIHSYSQNSQTRPSSMCAPMHMQTTTIQLLYSTLFPHAPLSKRTSTYS